MAESILPNEGFHFAFASDENFTVQLQVAVLSLVKSSSGIPGIQYIHILDCGILNKTWDALVITIVSFAKENAVQIEILRHDINMSLFAKFKEWNSSKAPYARLLLPYLLPNVRYCVYSDCDMLFFENPWELIDQLKHAGVAILGHKNSIDRGFTNPDARWFVDKNEPYNRDRYFCSGLIAMDLDKFRAPGVVDSMLDFLARHPDSVTADQPALNWFFRNDSALDDGVYLWGLLISACPNP